MFRSLVTLFMFINIFIGVYVGIQLFWWVAQYSSGIAGGQLLYFILAAIYVAINAISCFFIAFWVEGDEENIRKLLHSQAISQANASDHKGSDAIKKGTLELLECPGCGEKWEKQFDICPICGYELKRTLCPKCGKEIEGAQGKGFNLCPYCGARLNKNSEKKD